MIHDQFLLFAILVLQIVTIVMLSGNKKQSRTSNHAHKRVSATAGEGRVDKAPQHSGPRRDGVKKAVDGGRDGRPRQHAGKPQGQGQQDRQQQATAIDPMERSLRDINMRLKNAEREQENARRKIQENVKDGAIGGRDGNRDNGRPPRNDRNDRGDRNGRPDRGPRRDFNRIERRPERPQNAPENIGGAPAEFMPPAAMEAAPAPAMPPAMNQQFQPNMPPAVPVNPPSAPDMSGDMGGDEFQHGRRFTAKRRSLPDAANAEPTGDAPAPEVQQQQQEQPQGEQAGMQYGR